MTEISDDKADERKKRIIIHKRQNKNIKVCRRSRAELKNMEVVKTVFNNFKVNTLSKSQYGFVSNSI